MRRGKFLILKMVNPLEDFENEGIKTFHSMSYTFFHFDSVKNLPNYCSVPDFNRAYVMTCYYYDFRGEIVHRTCLTGPFANISFPDFLPVICI